ncbi:hypothetical protein ARMGADRAFT_432748 [Armillaria gallica]|uniref:Uncharacterized protein n=1 Tax=Armillaria gallica TaxID=47427 RepID=A0A2H3DC05_ARMGA|nr:hypothetical protein ARMGADRAFT_432748 [Armillaria gallica]
MLDSRIHCSVYAPSLYANKLAFQPFLACLRKSCFFLYSTKPNPSRQSWAWTCKSLGFCAASSPLKLPFGVSGDLELDILSSPSRLNFVARTMSERRARIRLLSLYLKHRVPKDQTADNCSHSVHGEHRIGGRSPCRTWNSYLWTFGAIYMDFYLLLSKREFHTIYSLEPGLMVGQYT